ncbi:MAG: replication-associated recombination protein A [Dehalococcoidales bacterium]|nr:replication-associated recombination protein A [Dehalococcoidales bacterium]
MDMFERHAEEQRGQQAPLATRMRPLTFNEYVGQTHIIGEGRVLRKAIEAGRIPSIVLWGPPGSGKTTLANVIANVTDAHFSMVSAVSSGVAELRKAIEQARERRRSSGQKTILFIDEIHRFNKTQQDAILPFVEDGTITLIGATTENPSFEVTSPLLSRAQVLTLNPLVEDEIRVIIMRALRDRLKGLGSIRIELEPDAIDHLISMSKGDARVALNGLEMAVMSTPPSEDGVRRVPLTIIEDAVQHPALRYDKAGDQHYDLISALHKSMRGSDPDASLYWLGRMLEGGEDPLYVVRRLVRFASEDIGMADPQALILTVAAQQAVHFVGMPECNLALAEAVVYLATAPKSNSLYEAYTRVQEEIKRSSHESVPMHLRNAVTPMMKQMGYGQGYKYAHDYEDNFVEQQNLPDSLQGSQYYSPTEHGYERQVTGRLRNWWQSKTKQSAPNNKPASTGDKSNETNQG